MLSMADRGFTLPSLDEEIELSYEQNELDLEQPISVQYPGHVITPDQSEASVQQETAETSTKKVGGLQSSIEMMKEKLRKQEEEIEKTEQQESLGKPLTNKLD